MAVRRLTLAGSKVTLPEVAGLPSAVTVPLTVDSSEEPETAGTRPSHPQTTRSKAVARRTPVLPARFMNALPSPNMRPIEAASGSVAARRDRFAAGHGPQ